MASYDEMTRALMRIANAPYADPEHLVEIAKSCLALKPPTLTERITKAIADHRAANLDMKVSEIFDAFVEIDAAINAAMDRQDGNQAAAPGGEHE